ncbi:LOW QUALITY PROTEIN: uncharacterized protein LOC134670115 [Cydia fagiglandana]|uniref:LOW QUALITY PROTEIN: uncharacterized protein LOC134670115 n=1 Tax=Cydia fagiglandana TaxID=1458189 RepID=UPI002FEE0E31
MWPLSALVLSALLAVSARELDPAACAARFDVQRDKIIRTEESREMGARYLAELDVGARQECLRLCCETDACDVFVYEEKSPGSCYLFACGPPEDFRCKFTAHGNFSSGVLAVARRRAEQQDRALLEQHERALASLRYRASTTASTTTSTTTPPPPPPPPPTPPPAPQLPPPRRCSRYQFECHTGGECIAVYNACDGVPQCADGSDEAPELGCPAPPTRAPTPPPPTQIQVQRDGEPCADGSDDAPELGCPAPPTRAPTPPPPTQIQDISVEVGGEGAAGERWPHRLAQAQPHRYSTNEVGGSHIFSHKGGLLQQPREEAPAPPFYEPQPAWPRAPWSQPQNVMDSGWGSYARPEWPEPDPRRAWPVPQPRPEPDIPVYIPSKTMPELPLAYGGQHTLRDAPKKGPPPPPPPTPPTPTPATAPPAPKREQENLSNKSTKQEASIRLDLLNTRRVSVDATPTPTRTGTAEFVLVPSPVAASGAGADIEVPRYTAAHAPHFLSDERDGLSDHPPAAVLLLVLGVLMTAAMAVLAGCRARAARRRLRRGKSPFAHDADYLVNGMYL